MTGNDDSDTSTVLHERAAGICLHLSSLPGPYGIGEIGDAAHAFIDTLVRMELGVWQFLPTGPTAFGDSPYQPLSTFAGNELLIDTATLVRAGLLTSNEADSLLTLPLEFVDYGKLIPKKMALLDRAAGRFNSHASAEIKMDFDRFLERFDRLWLHEYALYRVLKTQHHEQAWPQWQAEFVHRENQAIRKLQSVSARQIERIKVAQFIFYRQWQRLKSYAAERKIRLFGDMPIYIALDSSDTWANRELLQLDQHGNPDRVAGVPPDYFSADGQLWGNPLYDWQQHAANGYAWWAERMRQAVDLADIVRIDHFRGFESYWSVPFGAENARDGEWRPGPGTAIFDAMRDACGMLPIVAEDLGMITPEVQSLRDTLGLPGMRVLQFEVGNADFDPASIHANCVCYTGTHDNDTTVGWFYGAASDKRTPDEIAHHQIRVLRNSDGEAESIHKDMIRLAFSTSAQLAIAPMQDFLGLGSTARLNTPGTSANNWRWRLEARQVGPMLIDSVASMVTNASRNSQR
jgi:4-alpha-glucanotransferase